MGGYSRLKIMQSSTAANNYSVSNHIGRKNQEMLQVLNTAWVHGIKKKRSFHGGARRIVTKN
jgi:hypothetical protein